MGAGRIFSDFNPLPPHGGRLIVTQICVSSESISIHSLRMEGDSLFFAKENKRNYFNPLPPHGGRPDRLIGGKHEHYFNPLPPHGGRLT